MVWAKGCLQQLSSLSPVRLTHRRQLTKFSTIFQIALWFCCGSLKSEYSTLYRSNSIGAGLHLLPTTIIYHIPHTKSSTNLYIFKITCKALEIKDKLIIGMMICNCYTLYRENKFAEFQLKNTLFLSSMHS